MVEAERQTVEYKFLRQSNVEKVPKMRMSLVIFLGVFQIAFIVLFGLFAEYEENTGRSEEVPRLYAMFMDVHTMMFIGFGFLMTFLKRYGYSSVGFNFLVAAFVLEWALLVRGWIHHWEHGAMFTINIESLLVSDFCAAAVLISFGAVLGKASLTQLVVMAFFEVVIQSINEHIGLTFLKAYDVGESMYVHVFGAYFGLAVAKVLNTKEVESAKESSHYHSDLFAMVGTIFLWLYWPSFNSAVAVEEGQNRAIVNTFLSIASSCIVTFIVSTIVSKGKLDMVHIQNATLAGGVAVGTIADMKIQPFGAMLIGSAAGIISVLGYEYLTPALKRMNLHDTCGVNNLHGMPGLLSGIVGGIVAASASYETYNSRLYVFYNSRLPSINSTEFATQNLSLIEDFKLGGDGRSAVEQGGYQIAGLALTLALAIVGGALTGFVMKLPFIEQVNNEEDMFDDEPNWKTPQDYSLKLTEVRTDRVELETMTA